MTIRERTAYPRFKQSITADELTEFYTPTDEELALVQTTCQRRHAAFGSHRSAQMLPKAGLSAYNSSSADRHY